MAPLRSEVRPDHRESRNPHGDHLPDKCVDGQPTRRAQRALMGLLLCLSPGNPVLLPEGQLRSDIAATHYSKTLHGN